MARAWQSEDLARRLCHALTIAGRAVDRLGAGGYTDPDEPRNDLRPEKLISETAVLLLAASTAARQPGVSAGIESVARRLIPHSRSERMLLGICLEPALAWDYAQAHVCLRRLGYPDSRFDAVLGHSAGAQARDGHERPPHRMLETEWIAEMWDASRFPVRSRARRTAHMSSLNHPLDLLSGSRDDIYAFTHALMYVTGFTLSPRRLPRARAAILAEAEAALARCLDDEDYDLGGEVLMAWPLTGTAWSPAAAFGFRVLARVEDEAGFLPSPSTRLARLDVLQGDDRDAYLLATAYHTAYVMGLLCAAALQPGRTPPADIPTRGAPPAGAARFLEVLDADGRTPHWRRELDRLTEPERDAVAGLLLTIALRRKVALREFGAVRDLLEKGYELGLADGPAASQAAELLERLAIYASQSDHSPGSSTSRAPQSIAPTTDAEPEQGLRGVS